jgi:hypothetical protein
MAWLGGAGGADFFADTICSWDDVLSDGVVGMEGEKADEGDVLLLLKLDCIKSKIKMGHVVLLVRLMFEIQF